jgi:hypothetical protein
MSCANKFELPPKEGWPWSGPVCREFRICFGGNGIRSGICEENFRPFGLQVLRNGRESKVASYENGSRTREVDETKAC